MSDNPANQQAASAGPSTIAEVLKDLEPMGDLSRFAMDDLTPDDWATVRVAGGTWPRGQLQSEW